MPNDRRDPAPDPSRSGEIAGGHDLAGALHEVSNALTVVVGWLERALSAPLDPELRRALSTAHARACDGRDIARSAIGARLPSVVQQPLATLLHEAIFGVHPQASARDVHVVLRPLRDGNALVDDARSALQVLTNLLLNAVAFSPPGSQVEVEARTEHGDATVWVSDQGPGLSAERRKRLFERGLSEREGGAGIGLAHAYSLALEHGGTLALEESSLGARFRLEWPCAAVRSSVDTQPRPSVALRGRRVLLVEDDVSVVDLLDIALSARGAEVVSVATASALPQAIASGGFDVILVDWSPIASNPCAHLTSLRSACPHAPLVVISGSAALLDPDALALCSSWVRKPFDLAELVSSIATALAPPSVPPPRPGSVPPPRPASVPPPRSGSVPPPKS